MGFAAASEFSSLNHGKNLPKKPESPNAADAIPSKQNMSRLCFVFPDCVDPLVRSTKIRCILWFSLVRHAERRLKLSTNYFPFAMDNLEVVAHEVDERRGAPGSHEFYSGQKSVSRRDCELRFLRNGGQQYPSRTAPARSAGRAGQRLRSHVASADDRNPFDHPSISASNIPLAALRFGRAANAGRVFKDTWKAFAHSARFELGPPPSRISPSRCRHF